MTKIPKKKMYKSKMSRNVKKYHELEDKNHYDPNPTKNLHYFSFIFKKTIKRNNVTF